MKCSLTFGKVKASGEHFISAVRIGSDCKPVGTSDSLTADGRDRGCR